MAVGGLQKLQKPILGSAWWTTKFHNGRQLYIVYLVQNFDKQMVDKQVGDKQEKQKEGKNTLHFILVYLFFSSVFACLF